MTRKLRERGLFGWKNMPIDGVQFNAEVVIVGLLILWAACGLYLLLDSWPYD